MWIGSQRQWKPMEAGNSRAFNYEMIFYYKIPEGCSKIANLLNKTRTFFQVYLLGKYNVFLTCFMVGLLSFLTV
jgi:hypothetical protein